MLGALTINFEKKKNSLQNQQRARRFFFFLIEINIEQSENWKIKNIRNYFNDVLQQDQNLNIEYVIINLVKFHCILYKCN